MLPDSKLLLKTLERKEFVGGIKLLIIFVVAAPYLAIVPGCVRTNQFMPDPQPSQSYLKKSQFFPGEVLSRLVNSESLPVWTYSIA